MRHVTSPTPTSDRTRVESGNDSVIEVLVDESGAAAPSSEFVFPERAGHAFNSRSHDSGLTGVAIGTIRGISENGEPIVQLNAVNADEINVRWPARSLVAVGHSSIGAQVALAFENAKRD